MRFTSGKVFLGWRMVFKRKLVKSLIPASIATILCVCVCVVCVVCVCVSRRSFQETPVLRQKLHMVALRARGKKNMVNMYKCNLLEILVPLKCHMVALRSRGKKYGEYVQM